VATEQNIQISELPVEYVEQHILHFIRDSYIPGNETFMLTSPDDLAKKTEAGRQIKTPRIMAGFFYLK
jgi:hypothetical protein